MSAGRNFPNMPLPTNFFELFVVPVETVVAHMTQVRPKWDPSETKVRPK